MLWLKVCAGSSALAYSMADLTIAVSGRGVFSTSWGTGGLVDVFRAAHFLGSQGTAVQPYSWTWVSLVDDIFSEVMEYQ